MATARNYSNTASQAATSAAIASTDTTIPLSSFTGYPAAPFTAALARGTANEEIVLVTAVSGTSVTVTRGYDGTTAKAQGAGTTFQEVAIALDFRDANTHVVATSGVHGVTGSVVGTTDTQTLTNKTLTSPSISGPTITGTASVATATVTTLTVTGVTSLASLSTSGNATVGGQLTATGTINANGGVTIPSGKTLVAPTGSFSGLVSLNAGATVPTGFGITLTDAPVNGTDATNKSYVDSSRTARHAMRVFPTALTMTSGVDFAWTNWPAAADFDTEGVWDAANKRIVIPAGKAGRWRLHMKLNLGGSTSMTSLFFLRFIKGAAQTSPPTNALASTGIVTAQIYCDLIHEDTFAAGDIVTVQAYVSVAGIGAGGASFGGPSFLHVEYLGA